LIEVDGEERTIGLALSGGGFRASIFHMGVLRRLDELGILDKIDVISTVSGGSIVGAYYVLRRSRGDSIKQIEAGFKKALKANVRLRGLSGSWIFHPLQAAQSLVTRKSRTNITSSEYDRLLFKDGGVTQRLSQLPDFPKLIINATCLNSGSIWKFNKRKSGDYNYESYELKDNPDLPIADAVGASAAVPGLFPPLVLAGKSEGKKRVLLSDGGVRDNQGLMSIFSSRCDYLICPDASGLLEENDDVSGLATSVLLRSNSITMDATRDLLIREIFGRLSTGSLKQSVLFTLKTNLDKDEDQDWGLPRVLIALAARIRTDLDWFSDEEIETLMYHGYTLLDRNVKKHGSDLLQGTVPDVPWKIDYDAAKIAAIQSALAKSDRRRIRPHKFR
jgi:NTE family protein